MLTLLRRFLVLAALMFWQGGFTFYAAVVVPIGQAEFGPEEQGFLTRQVTNWLNVSGGVALTILAWDAFLSGDPSKGRRRTRWLSWSTMMAGLVLLVWLHQYLDQMLDPETRRVLSRRSFHFVHRGYLWTSTLQWTCGLVYALLTLQAWRWEDQLGKTPAAKSFETESTLSQSSVFERNW